MLRLQNVPPFHMVAGNPARIIKELPRSSTSDLKSGAEVPMAGMAEKLEDGSRF